MGQNDNERGRDCDLQQAGQPLHRCLQNDGESGEEAHIGDCMFNATQVASVISGSIEIT